MSKPASHGDAVLVIRDPASLGAWRRHLYAPTLTKLLPVTFDLPSLSSEQNQVSSALVTAYAHECGCSSGRFFMSAAAVASIIAYFLSGGHLTHIGIRQVISLLVITIFAALSGKLVGLTWARWRLIRVAKSIYEKVASPASPRGGGG